MSHVIAMIIASSGIALATSGPDKAADCDSSKEKACCPMTAAASEKECDDSSKMTCDTTAEISTEAYANAAWPAHNEDLYSKDFQGQALPAALGSEIVLAGQVNEEGEISTAGKVVVLDFWATWCPPCRAASPILHELQKENPDTLAVLAIAGQRDPVSDVRAYVEKNPVAYTNLYDTEQTLYKQFESRGIPLVVVMSTDGIIRWTGNPHDEAFLAAVNQTLEVDPALQMMEAQASIVD